MNPVISAVALPRLVLALSVLAVMAFPAYAGGAHHGELSDALNPLSPQDNAPTGSEHQHNHNEGAGPVGKPAQPSVADRVIKVGLTDEMKINFSEELATIKSGTTIQFIVTNEGKIAHEFSIGNEAEQREHAEMMRRMPSMVHADGNILTVEPGMTKFLTWQFEGDDVVVFACNIPGHYEAGMFQKVELR